jgi:hypothetical protein
MKAFCYFTNIHIVNNIQFCLPLVPRLALTFLLTVVYFILVFASSFQSVLDKKSKQKNQAKTNPRPGVLAGLRAVLFRANDIFNCIALFGGSFIIALCPDINGGGN